jgi:hypothetical protein
MDAFGLANARDWIRATLTRNHNVVSSLSPLPGGEGQGEGRCPNKLQRRQGRHLCRTFGAASEAAYFADVAPDEAFSVWE